MTGDVNLFRTQERKRIKKSYLITRKDRWSDFELVGSYKSDAEAYDAAAADIAARPDDFCAFDKYPPIFYSGPGNAPPYLMHNRDDVR
jgi:hypothetical protein